MCLKWLFHHTFLAVPCSNENFCLPNDFVCCTSELEVFKDIEVLQLLLLCVCFVNHWDVCRYWRVRGEYTLLSTSWPGVSQHTGRFLLHWHVSPGLPQGCQRLLHWWVTRLIQFHTPPGSLMKCGSLLGPGIYAGSNFC